MVGLQRVRHGYCSLGQTEKKTGINVKVFHLKTRTMDSSESRNWAFIQDWYKQVNSSRWQTTTQALYLPYAPEITLCLCTWNSNCRWRMWSWMIRCRQNIASCQLLTVYADDDHQVWQSQTASDFYSTNSNNVSNFYCLTKQTATVTITYDQARLRGQRFWLWHSQKVLGSYILPAPGSPKKKFVISEHFLYPIQIY